MKRFKVTFFHHGAMATALVRAANSVEAVAFVQRNFGMETEGGWMPLPENSIQKVERLKK